MSTTIRRQIEKRCPYVNELDIGVLTIEFCGEAPELHELAREVDALTVRPISHEKFTAAVRRLVPDAVTVSTHWHTGPWSVDVTEPLAVLRESIDAGNP